MSAIAAAPRPAEAHDVHTRLLRVALAPDESRLYWRHVDPRRPVAEQAVRAFEERWFGNKSLARVRVLLAVFTERFGAFPEALAVLRRWQPADPWTRRNLCHWHAQLTDPLYRAYTGDFLPRRWLHPEPSVDRGVTQRWLDEQTGDKWSPATTVRMANGFLTAAAEAGLCTGDPGRRRLRQPTVTDDALTYLLYLLRQVDFEGSLFDNPYLLSVGLSDLALEKRLRRLSALDFQRMGDLLDFGWRHPDLRSWAGHQLAEAAA